MKNVISYELLLYYLSIILYNTEKKTNFFKTMNEICERNILEIVYFNFKD